MHQRLGNLQALRGAAVLLVVLFHVAAHEYFMFGEKHYLRPFLSFGYCGVDLFFVLSGFIIAYIHRDAFGKPGAVPTFLYRRFSRIYPTYWAALIVVIAWFAFEKSQSPLIDSATLARAVWLIPEICDLQTWIPQAWTLSYEVAFYLAFAIILFLPRALARATLAVWLGWVVVLSLKTHPPVNRFSVLWGGVMVTEFLLGVFVGCNIRPGWSRYSSAMLLLAAAWLASASMLTTIEHETQSQKGLRVLIFAMPATLIVASLGAKDLVRGWPLPRWLQAIGEASYSIYLLHLLAQVIVNHVWRQAELPNTSLVQSLWLLTSLTAGLGGGWLFHMTLERPLLRLMKPPKPSAMSKALLRTSNLHEEKRAA